MAANPWEVVSEAPFTPPQKTPWRTMPEAAQYLDRIDAVEKKYGLPTGMLGALLQRESNFNPTVVSPKGATGLAQIMPKEHPGVDPLDPEESIDYAGQYLRQNYDQLGTWDKALAAYNHGPGNVGHEIDQLGENWRTALPTETLGYVHALNPSAAPPANDPWTVVSEAPYVPPPTRVSAGPSSGPPRRYSPSAPVETPEEYMARMRESDEAGALITGPSTPHERQTWRDTFGSLGDVIAAGYRSAKAGATAQYLMSGATAETETPEQMRERYRESEALGVPIGPPQGELKTTPRLLEELAPQFEAQQQASQTIQQAMQGKSLPQRGILSVGASAAPVAGSMAVGLATRNPALAAASLYPTTAGSSFLDFATQYAQQHPERTDQQVAADLARAMFHGRIQGGIESATELLPFVKLVERWVPFLRRAGEMLKYEIPGELVAATTQAMDEAVARAKEDAPLGDTLVAGAKEGLSQTPDVIAATVLQSLLSAGLSSGIDYAAEYPQRREYNKAKQQVEGEFAERLQQRREATQKAEGEFADAFKRAQTESAGGRPAAEQRVEEEFARRMATEQSERAAAQSQLEAEAADTAGVAARADAREREDSLVELLFQQHRDEFLRRQAMDDEKRKEAEARAGAEAELSQAVDERAREQEAQSLADALLMHTMEDPRAMQGRRPRGLGEPPTDERKERPAATMPPPASTGSRAPESVAGVGSAPAPSARETAVPPAGATGQTPAAPSQLTLFPSETAATQPAAPSARAAPPVPTPSPAPPAAPVSTGVAPAGGAAPAGLRAPQGRTVQEMTIPVDDNLEEHSEDNARLAFGAGEHVTANDNQGKPIHMVNMQDKLGQGVIIAFNENGDQIGSLKYSTPAYQGRADEHSHVSVDKAYRDKGIPYQMARLARATGGVMPSKLGPEGQPATEEGKRFAENLQRQLEAEKQPAPAAAPAPAGPREGKVGDKLAAGEVVLTATGRQTSPFPKVDLTSNRKAGNTVARVDQWLMQNAIDEARARGDDFNARQFEANKARPSQADKDSAEHYLFDKEFVQTPYPKTVKPLAPAPTEQVGMELPQPKEEPKPQKKKAKAEPAPAPAPEREPTGGEQVTPQPYGSGMSRPADLRGAVASPIGAGVVATELSAKTMDQIAEAIASGKPIFVDSGAFSAFKAAMKAGKASATKADFNKVFAKYRQLIEKINARLPATVEGRGSRGLLSLVAPDVVGDQVASLDLLRKHAEEVGEWIDQGYEVIVPFQKGPLKQSDVYKQVIDILGTTNFVVGIPSNAEALSNDDFRELVSQPYKPERLHILGAVNSPRVEERMQVIREEYKDEVPGVTTDANLIRSKTDQLRGLKGEDRVRAITDILAQSEPEAKAELPPQKKTTPKPAPENRVAEPAETETETPTDEDEEVTELDQDVGAQAAGTTEGTTQTDTPQFRAWFGDSKVVDKNGDPKVMYHGNAHTGGNAFEIFDRMMSHTDYARRAVSMDTVGSWFSDAPEGGNLYAGSEGAVYPVYLSIENPWHATWDEFIHKMHTTAGRDPKRQNPRGRGSTEELRAWLQANGYDGIVFPRQNFDGVMQQVWVALEPTQIKSATGNTGAFDPNNPSMMRDAGDVEEAAREGLAKRTGPEPEEGEVAAREGLQPTDPLAQIAQRRLDRRAAARRRERTPPVAPKRNAKGERSKYDTMWRDLLGIHEVGPLTPIKEQTLRRVQNMPMERQVKIARQRLTKYFGFKDIVIDPKLSSREAMDVMLDAYNNLHTMAAQMLLPRQAMGFNGELTMALTKSLGNKGTRGMFSWAAWEPGKGFDTSVLSLARRADSFTHEWFHALDMNLFMRLVAPTPKMVTHEDLYTMKPLEQMPKPIRDAFTGVMRAIFLVDEASAVKMGNLTVEAAKVKAELDKAQAALERSEAILRDAGMREERAKKFEQGNRAHIAEKMRARTKQAEDEVAAQRAEVERLTKELERVNTDMLALLNKKGTAYHHMSRYVDKLTGRNYFALPAELLARAGEAWMGNRIGQQAGTEFLSGSPDWYNHNSDRVMQLVYPNAAEREGIFKKIDQLFDTLSKEQYFTGDTVAARIPATSVFDNELAQLAMTDEEVSAIRKAYNSARNDFVNLVTAPIDLLRPSTWEGVKGVPGKIAGSLFRSGLAPTHLSVEETLGILQIIHRDNPELSQLLRKFKFMVGTNPGSHLPNQTAPAQERVDRLKNQWHAQIKNIARDYGMDPDNDAQMAELFEELARPTEQVREDLKEHKAFLEREITANEKDANKKGQVAIMRDNLREIERRLRMTPPPAKPSTNVQKAAQKLRELGDEMYYKAHDAGIDLGYVSNHVRRVLREDSLKDEAARTRFIERATLAYQATKDLHTMRGQRKLADLLKEQAKWEAVVKRTGQVPPPLAKVRKQIAEVRSELEENDKANPAEQALNYLEQILMPDLFLGDQTTPAEKFTKQRVLAPAADLLLSEFYDQNPIEAMYGQASTVAARAVYADMFGHDNSKLLDIRDKLVKAGLDREDLHFIDDAVRVAFGQTAVNFQGILQAVPNWIMLLVTQRLLGNSIFSNLTEPMNVGKRTGSVVDSFEGLLHAYAPILTRGNEREIVYVMEQLGLLADSSLESVFADRYGTGKENGLYRRWQNRYGKVSLLNWATRRSRISNYRVLSKFVQFMAFSLRDGDAVQKQEAINEMNDFGVPEDKREEFAEFMRSLPKGGMITPRMMQEIDNHEMKELYGAVMYRVIRQSTQLAQRTEKARGGVGNSIIGRWTYAISGFNRSYERNVVQFNIKRIWNAPTWKRKGAHAIAYLTVSGTVAMMTMMVNEMRRHWTHVLYELIKGGDDDDDDEGITGMDVVNAFDRSGDTGRFSDLLNFWTRFKHQRDFSTIFMGPVPGYMGDNLGRMFAGLVLPDATDAAQRRGWAALWDSTVGLGAAPLMAGRDATGLFGWMVMTQLQSRGLRDLVSEGIVPKTPEELKREANAKRQKQLEHAGMALPKEEKAERDERLKELGMKR